ncbi:DUF397 domain-containing protein [Actinomadura sp. RB99]|uniref:DUF397 domain-containing protein n=1 Tax=Actinomadura sp. RB99 TaxID=2691577 RepID=UPI00168494E3
MSATTESHWRKSSRCVADSNCVEVARIAAGKLGVRDTKTGPDGPVLTLASEVFTTFLAKAKAGDLDLQ